MLTRDSRIWNVLLAIGVAVAGPLLTVDDPASLGLSPVAAKWLQIAATALIGVGAKFGNSQLPGAPKVDPTVPLILVACLLLPSVASAQEVKDPPDHWMRAGLVALTAVTVADIDTTRAGLERGLVERNPIYQPFADSPGTLGLVNGAISGAVGLGTYALHRKGKRTEAKIVVWVWTAIRAAVVIHNVRQLRHAR